MLAFGDVGDQLERRPVLLTHDPPASSRELTDAAEVLLIFDLDLFRVPHVGAVDHESVGRSSDVLLVATATANVSGAAGVIVVEDNVQCWAVLDDLLEIGMVFLDRVHATIGSLDRGASTSAGNGSV